jgi:hypothetical protein
MWPAVMTSLSQLPFLLGSLMLLGVAVWGWRRTSAPGALLIAVGAAVQTLNQLFGMWTMAQLYLNHSPASYAVKMTIFAGLRSTAGMVAQTLVIVGVALLLRLLPARQR